MKRYLIILLILLVGCAGKAKPTTIEIRAKDLAGNDLVETYVIWEK